LLTHKQTLAKTTSLADVKIPIFSPEGPQENVSSGPAVAFDGHGRNC